MSEPEPFLRLGLTGYPLGHSFSPPLHHAALAHYGLRGEYALFAIPPDDAGREQVRALVERLRDGTLRGLNVTIPHKQLVIPFVDRLSDVARAVGAVNTLVLERDGRLAGHNTDVPGFLRDVQLLVGTGAGRAVVLGAGGSARAVVYALAQAGWQVAVLARRPDQAAALASEIGRAGGLAGRLSAGLLDAPSLAGCARDCDLLVNTTPLGMYPDSAGCPWPAELPLPERAAVYDLVYNPLETVLVRRARAAGRPAANGAGMLVNQAALAFSLWTGREPPFEVMERAFYDFAISNRR